MRTNNKLSPYGARSGNWTSVRVSQQIMHLVEFKMNYAKYMLYFYQVFWNVKLFLRLNIAVGWGKGRGLIFILVSCLLHRKNLFSVYFRLYILRYVFFLNRASKHQLSVASFLVSLFINFSLLIRALTRKSTSLFYLQWSKYRTHFLGLNKMQRKM